MTQGQAQRIHARTAVVVANMRAEADVLESRGDVKGAAALRMVAESRERAGMRAREGARIGRV